MSQFEQLVIIKFCQKYGKTTAEMFEIMKQVSGEYALRQKKPRQDRSKAKVMLDLFFLIKWHCSRRWCGLTSIGQYTEELKDILKREGISIFRKGSEKLEQQAKRRMKKKEKRKKGMKWKKG